MAKDGTNRGNKTGNYNRAGRKPKPLSDKIIEGRTDVTIIALPEPVNLKGVEMPTPKEYMKAEQKSGRGLCAEEIYRETWQWIQKRGCEKLVGPLLVDQYAMACARLIQCEEAISEYGFLSRHPTTQNPIASPYVTMSHSYMKQVNQFWFQIYQIVRDNCSEPYQGQSPQDDVMERLLNSSRR